MASKWDGKFNGTYETSKYAERTFEEEILDCGCGLAAYPDENGNLVREMDDRIDNWFEGDGKGNYPHYYYKKGGEYDKAPDGRHDEDDDQRKS